MKNLRIAAVMILALAACSPDTIAENIIEQQNGVDDVQIEENNGTVQIEVQGEDGDSSAVIGGGELPSDLPIEVPDGYTVNAVFQSGSDFSANLTYPADQYNDVVSAFKSFVESGAVSDLVTYSVSTPPAENWTFTAEGRTFNISVVDNETEVLVNIIGGSS